MRSYDKRKSLDQISNLTVFSDELKYLIVKIQEEIKSKFHNNKEFDVWKRTEENQMIISFWKQVIHFERGHFTLGLQR